MPQTRSFAAVALLLIAAAPALGQSAPAPHEQMSAAVLAAPADLRDGARILGFDLDGNVFELREGTNDLVCIADDPSQEGFEVSCYHTSLEPYFARGRELRKQGVENTQQVRWEEVKAGKLKVPDVSATQYVLGGEDAVYDSATMTITGGMLRWNVYVPYATVESSGLSTKYAPNAPWIMYPGTPGAHIMIVPGG